MPGDPDAIYAYDPTLLTTPAPSCFDPGKAGRRGGARGDGARPGGRWASRSSGVLEAPGTAEGGDMFWLDEHTLLIGRGYRTNDDGIAQLAAMLEPAGCDVVWFDLPARCRRVRCACT